MYHTTNITNLSSMKIIISLVVSLILHGILLMSLKNKEQTPFTSPPSNLVISLNNTDKPKKLIKEKTPSNPPNHLTQKKSNNSNKLVENKFSKKTKNINISQNIKNTNNKNKVEFIPVNHFKEKTFENKPSDTTYREIKENYISHLRTAISNHQYYPLRARQMRLQGDLKIQFVILNSGIIEQVSINSSSGQNILDRAAKKTVLKMGRYKPFPNEITDRYLSVIVPMKYYIN